jgi:hypothetical protein
MENVEDTNLEFVNKRGKIMKTPNTQWVLLECLTDEMLNPLLQKFESQQIVKDIYDMRKNDKKIQTHYDISSNIVIQNKNKTLKRSTGFKRIKTEMNKSYENYTRKRRIPQY